MTTIIIRHHNFKLLYCNPSCWPYKSSAVTQFATSVVYKPYGICLPKIQLLLSLQVLSCKGKKKPHCANKGNIHSLQTWQRKGTINAKREKKVHPSCSLSSQLKSCAWTKHVAVCTASGPPGAHMWQAAAADSLTKVPDPHTIYQKTDSWEGRCSNLLKAYIPKAYAPQVPKTAEHWAKKSWFVCTCWTLEVLRKYSIALTLWVLQKYSVFLSYLNFTHPLFFFTNLCTRLENKQTNTDQKTTTQKRHNLQSRPFLVMWGQKWFSQHWIKGMKLIHLP